MDKDHDEIKERLTSIEGRLEVIEADLKPVTAEREFRRRLDDKVGKWLPRTPYIIMVVSAVIYVIVWKTILPLLNQAAK